MVILAVSIAALVLAGCSGSVSVDQLSGRVDGGTDAPPDAPPPDAGSQDAGSQGDGGPQGGGICTGGVTMPPYPQPGNPCACDGASGFLLGGDCDALALPAPFFKEPELMPFCSVGVPFAMSSKCKWKVDFWLGACASTNTTPCIFIEGHDDTTMIEFTGLFVDGNGAPWSLSEVVVNGDLPWAGPKMSGTFGATATGPGGKTLKLEGSFDVCVAETVVCPI